MHSGRPRVLWVSESPRLHTGFGRVAREVASRLAQSDKYELAVLGWGADPVKADGEQRPVYREYRPSSRPWDREHLELVVQDFAPHVLISLGPPDAFEAVAALRERDLLHWIAHPSLEAGPLSASHRAVLKNAAVLVAPSRWCANLLDGCGGNNPAQVIPHGVCPETFRPLAGRDQLRTEAGLADRFVVGCVARNSFRKQLPILLEAFSRLASAHPEAFLYLHTDPEENSGWPLHELVQRWGLAERTAFTRGLSGVVGIGDEDLNRVYNLFDVMALPSMGEGFCLPLLEAMAAGVPVVATDCSAVSELVAGRGELITVERHLIMTWDGAEYALADVDDLAAKLARLHGDEALRRQHVSRARALAEALTWETVVGRWQELIDDLVHAGPKDSARWARRAPAARERRTRVALVGPWNIPCGVAEEMRILAQGALRPVQVFSELDPPGELVEDDGDTIRCYRRAEPEYDRLFKELMGWGADVVHVQFNHGLFHGDGLARLLWRLRQEGVRTVLTLHSTGADLSRLANAADVVVVTSAAARHRLVARGVSEHRIRTIPLPVRALPPRAEESVDEEHWSGFEPTIITTGFCLPHKGLDDLIRALGRLTERFPRIGLLALCPRYPGSPESERHLDRCRALVEQLGLSDRVVLDDTFQPMERIARAAKRADVIAFPYRHGSFQDSSGALRMVIDAPCPLVVTDIELFSEIPERAAVRVPPRSPARLAAAIEQVLAEDKLRSRTVVEKQLVSQMVDEPSTIIRHWCEAYQALGELRVHFEGTVDSYFSFAQVLRHLAFALDDAGCEVSVDRWTAARADHFVASERLRQLGARSPCGGLTVRMSYPHQPEGIRGDIRCIMFPWEVTRVPAALVERLATGPDRVLAVSSFVREALVASGLDPDRVCVVPHGVDSERFSPIGRRADIGELAKRGWYSRPDLPLAGTFRFLHLGHAQVRKGTDLVLSAFCEEFTGRDDVCLVVKSYDMGDISRWLSDLESRYRDLPRIVYVYEDASEQDLPCVYRACHALAHPSRGEGFGLPILEAMACGLPTIVTGWGGHMDVCSDTTNYLLDYKLGPVRRFQVRVPKDAQWAEPDKKSLRALLRWTVEHTHEARDVGRRARVAAQSWTWQKAAIQLLQQTGMLAVTQPDCRIQLPDTSGSRITAARGNSGT